MKMSKFITFIIMGAVVLVAFPVLTAYSQAKHGPLTQIIIYKGEVAGTGTGITTFKFTVGDEMTVTAKGVDADGHDVPVWPTWKADKELSVKVVEGRSKTAVVKALKEGAPVFFSAVYITDDGKKVIGEVMGEIKAKK